MLSGPERRDLTIAMLTDVLERVKGAKGNNEIMVVSSDGRVLREAAAAGVNFLGERSDRGVNAAVNLAIRATADADGWLVLPSDLPFIRTEDIDEVLWLGREGRIVISPSRRLNGTNALFLGRDFTISLSYDKESFWTHLCRAARQGLPVAVYGQMTMLLDIDSPSDVAAAMKQPGDNRTVKFLRKHFSRRRT